MDNQKIEAVNITDHEGRPAGGHVDGPGLHIEWQNGPLGVVGERREPNGAFVETVLRAAKQRIEHYQDSKFACRENALAITKIDEALHWLAHRTQRREAVGIEGTHEVDDTERG